MGGSRRFCVWCGHELTEETRFCTACGRAVDEQNYRAAAEEAHGALPGERYGTAASSEDYGNPLAAGAPAPPSGVTAPDPVTAEWQQQPNDLMSAATVQRSEELADHPGLAEHPADRQWPVEERTGGTHRGRWLIALAAVLLVAAGGTAAALFLLHSSRGKAIATGGSTSPASNTQPSQPPSANPTPTPTPSPALSQVTTDGVPVDISTVNTDGSATAVARTLGTYFGGINSQNYTQAYNTFTPSLQASIPYQNWSSGLTTTKDTKVVVEGIQHHPNGEVNATLSFRSHQAPQYGPVAGDTCDNWQLDYRLVPSGSASPPYLIKKVKPVGTGYQAC